MERGKEKKGKRKKKNREGKQNQCVGKEKKKEGRNERVDHALPYFWCFDGQKSIGREL